LQLAATQARDAVAKAMYARIFNHIVRCVNRSLGTQPDAPPVAITDVFAPGMMRCPVFRIPCVLPLPGGVVLAFAEARQSWHDHGVIDLVCLGAWA